MAGRYRLNFLENPFVDLSTIQIDKFHRIYSRANFPEWVPHLGPVPGRALNILYILISNYRTKVLSISDVASHVWFLRRGSYPRGKRDGRLRYRAGELRGPAGIARRVSAERRKIVDYVSQGHWSVERLRINLIILRCSYSEAVDGKGAVELKWARIAATPSCHCLGGDCAGSIVHGYHLSRENSCHAGR